MTIGHSEAEPFWTEFLRSLTRRGLRGVRLVISDAHEGLKAAITKVLSATWQRCRVHFMRNALAYAGKTQRRIVSAWVGTAFAQDDADAARKQWRDVADQVRPRVPKLAGLMDAAEPDVLAYMAFPTQHRAKLHSTDEIDKTFHSKSCYGALARMTPWRRVEHRMRVPPGRLFTDLPAWSVRAPLVGFPIVRRSARTPARRVGQHPFPDCATP